MIGHFNRKGFAGYSINMSSWIAFFGLPGLIIFLVLFIAFFPPLGWIKKFYKGIMSTPCYILYVIAWVLFFTLGFLPAIGGPDILLYLVKHNIL